MATLTDAIGKADAARKTTGPPPGVDTATGEVAESAQPAAPAKAKAKRSPKAAAQAAAEVNVLVASADAAGLKAMARDRGLATTGTKREVAARIAAHDADTAAARRSVTKRPENTKRVTVDLDPERWKALRLAAVDAGMPAARLLRVCVDRIAADPGFAAEVAAAAAADGGVR